MSKPKRSALIASVCLLVLPVAAWANDIFLVNQFGSVTISEAGVVSTRSELTAFNRAWKKSPPGRDLGWISFSTGALLSGSISTGGTFSSTGSSYIATGFGQFGVPKGTIFSGSFFGPIGWTLAGQSGNHYIFDLSGNLVGTLYNGRTIEGSTVQTVYVSVNPGNQNLGHIHSGRSAFGDVIGVPEPGATLLFGSGLTIMFGLRAAGFRSVSCQP
jgi:hypothetical protein